MNAVRQRMKVHQLEGHDRELGISYWTKNYRTGIELEDPEALDRRYPYYDPISTLGEEGVRALAGALPAVVADGSDLDARAEAQYGAWLCGAVLGATTMSLRPRGIAASR